MYMGLHAMAARMHTSRTTPGGDRGGGGTTRASPDATDKRARTDSRIPEAQRRSLRTQSPESPRNYRPVSVERLALCRLRSHVRRARVITRGALDCAQCIAISLAGCRSCPPITRAPLW